MRHAKVSLVLLASSLLGACSHTVPDRGYARTPAAKASYVAEPGATHPCSTTDLVMFTAARCGRGGSAFSLSGE